jgi:multiple sugar transport system substrate-binding protein
MKRTRGILLVAAVLMLCAVMQAGANGSGENLSMTVWIQKTFVPEANDALKARFEEWGTKNGVKVSCEIQDNAVLMQKLAAAIEAKNPPDICYTYQSKTTEYANKGLLVDVSDVIEQVEKDNGKMFEAAKREVLFKGKAYAVPISVNCYPMWYRKDMLAKAGFKEPPKTWEELRVQAKAVTSAKDGIWGVGFGFGPTATDHKNMMNSVLWSYGGGIIKDDKVIADTPESIAAFKIIADIIAESNNPDGVTGDDMYNNKAYLSGSTCFILNLPSIAAALKKDAPDIWANTGVAPWPAGPKGRFSIIVGSAHMVFKKEKNAAAAKKLLGYVLDKAWYDKWIKAFAPLSMPVYEASLSDPFFQNDPVNKAVIESVKTGYSEEYPSKSMTPIQATLVNQMFPNKVHSWIVTDKMTVEAAVKRYADQCRQIVADLKAQQK